MNVRVSSLSILLAAVLGTGSVACAPTLRIKKVEAAEEKPSNVLFFFRVTSGGDEPVEGLTESAFVVKEDERPIPAGPERVLVNPDLRALQATIVILDLGGPPAQSDLDAMTSAAQIFVDRLGASKRLGIYAVDGAEQPQVLAPIGASPDALKAAVAKIPTLKTRDPSLDLHSGYVAALKALKQASPVTIGPRIGSLVVIARGPDRAGRVDLKTASEQAKKSEVDVARYVLLLGNDAMKSRLAPLADGAPIVTPTADALRGASMHVANAIDARGRSFYLLSYCSAARAGEHQVKLDVTREYRNGTTGQNEKQTGTYTHVFKADGFGPGCTPSVPEGWRDATLANVKVAPTGTGK